MNKNGFTLIELLGVIVLLAVLGVIIIPKVGNSITNSKNQAYDAQVINIKNSANDFLIDNTEVMKNNDIITIKLGVLKQGGYLPVNVKNPITGKIFSNESVIKVTKNNEKYDFELTLIDLEDVNETIDSNYPILVLNGSYIEYVNINEEYKEKNATAQDSNGNNIEVSIQIKDGNQEVQKIDTSSFKTYNIVYSATDKEKRTTTATRTVIIRDNEAPKITFPKETTLSVEEVSSFDLNKDVVVTDNYDKNIKVSVNSQLSNKVGNHVITYTATDSSQNQTIERRVINVVLNK